jgi:hypothetical protein
VAEVEPVWPQEEVAAHGVVDDEPRDEPHDVPRHPDVRRKRSSRRRAERTSYLARQWVFVEVCSDDLTITLMLLELCERYFAGTTLTLGDPEGCRPSAPKV